jgi:hypothetical protein
MAEQATNISSVANRAVVQGRIASVRMYEGNHYHVITTPAKDAYSKPQELDVRARTRLGEPGQEVNVKGTLHGYARTFDRQDGSKGTSVAMWIEVD